MAPSGCCPGVNALFAPLKQRYSTEASLQHCNLRHPPPGRLPQPIGGDGQQQLCAHQRGRQGLRQEEERPPDVSSPGRWNVNRPTNIYSQDSEKLRLIKSPSPFVSTEAETPKETSQKKKKRRKVKKKTPREQKTNKKRSREPEAALYPALHPPHVDRNTPIFHPAPESFTIRENDQKKAP